MQIEINLAPLIVQRLMNSHRFGSPPLPPAYPPLVHVIHEPRAVNLISDQCDPVLPPDTVIRSSGHPVIPASVLIGKWGVISLVKTLHFSH